MNFSVPGQVKNSIPVVVNIVFYGTLVILIVAVLCYFIFVSKISANTQKVNELDTKLVVYASQDQRAAEKQVFDYKRKLDDFAILINNHKVSSNLFGFLEKNTLPNVWYGSLSLSESKSSISLLGEAEDMQTLSHQVRIFEASKDYVSNISLLSSQITGQKKTKFSLNLDLNPNIFAPNENK